MSQPVGDVRTVGGSTCNVGNLILRLCFLYFGLLVDVKFVKVLLEGVL